MAKKPSLSPFLTNGRYAEQITGLLAGDRRLRRIFYEAVDTADEVVACIVGGLPDDEPAADLLCELDWQLRHEYPVDDDVFEVIKNALLDDIYYRCAAAGALE